MSTIMGSVTISGDFISHVRDIFWQAIDRIRHGTISREGINVFTSDAPAAYICSVAAVEAYVNEMVFGLPTFPKLEESPLGMLDMDWLEKLELKQKFVIIPQLLFGSTFNRGAQPYQDMSTLISIRNHMVHYKMKDATPKYLESLEQRGIALTSSLEGADYIWLHKLSCSEGIRWANNTATDLVHSFADLASKTLTVPSFLQTKDNFIAIEIEQVKQRIRNIEETL